MYTSLITRVALVIGMWSVDTSMKRIGNKKSGFGHSQALWWLNLKLNGSVAERSLPIPAENDS